MKSFRTFSSICCFFTVVSLVSANPKNVGDKQLEAKLKSENDAVRLETVRSLVFLLPNNEARRILVNYYRTLPKKRFPVNEEFENERLIIIESIAKDKSKDSEQFLAEVIEEEYGTVQKAEEDGRGKYLPLIVRESALHLTTLYYQDSELLEQVIDRWLKSDLDFDFKRELSAVMIIFDLKQKGIAVIHEQVKYIVEKIKPGPIAPIPENIYADKEKRMAYDDTKKREAIIKYNRSQEGISEYGLEIALKEYIGRTGVEYILGYMRDNKMDQAKADQLMVIASQIMGDYVNVTRKLSAEDKKVLDEIQKYSEGMENQGVFDREDRVKQNLNRIRELLK